MNPFWIVVSETRGPSSFPYRHLTQAAAIAESIRLTRQYGGTYFVMEAKIVTQKNDVTVKRLSYDSDLPF